MRKQFHPNAELYRQHFHNQQGGAILPGFKGASIQRGYGLGSMFRSLFRTFVPLLKTGAKTVGEKALNTGIGVAQDVLAGKNLRTAAIDRARQAGQELKSQALNAANDAFKTQSGRGMKNGAGIKRRSTAKHASRPPTKRAKTSLTQKEKEGEYSLLSKKEKK